MPVFFFFNADMANLFAPGVDRPQALRNRDVSFMFPLMLFMGSLTGAPQLVLPLALYMLFGQQGAPSLGNINNATVLKVFAVVAIAFLMFWDFFPSFEPSEEEIRMERRRRGSQPPPQQYQESDDSGMVFSALSEISLVLLVSLVLGLLSHWEDVHSWISRTLPRSLSREFRRGTRFLGIHPNTASQVLRPASGDAIAALETVHFSASGQGECSICLETFKIGESAKKLPCKHLFHETCVMPWFEQRSSCPVCRASVEQREEDGESTRSNMNPGFSPGRSDLPSVSGGITAVFNALRSVVDPTAVLNQGLRVEDRDSLMQLTTRELRERARARNLSLAGVVEKRDIVDLLLASPSVRT